MIDEVTQRWIRNVSDERAVANGCKFDEARGQIVVDFVSNLLCLYEGDCAGEPFIPLDWFHDATMRVFGWIRFSKKWNRWIRRFNAASIWVPKKNAKSPGIAAWSLYLLAGDGEQGQKVYLGAKDGQQSREIAGKHAIEMCYSSPKLMEECSINKSLMQITHEPTRSILKPISSGDARHQKSKEGLNGSILIDETHVVDQEFMNRISRAGISRSEPLLAEFSTAGNDPESYGRKRYEYGKRVESGERDDQSFFFVSYEAPQDLADDQLAADPLKYGQMANPAWGHTVNAEEFMDDYNRSKGSISDLADFKMYRLNIWQASSNPWLDMGHWAACGRTMSLEDIEQLPCVGAAIDLARCRDTCVMVLVFRVSESEKIQVPFYWLPRKRAEKLRDKVRYLQWSHDGHMKLIDGESIDFAVIEQDIVDIYERFPIPKLAFDDYYAEQLIQRLVRVRGIFSESDVINYGMSIKDLAGPTDRYEGAIIDHTLLHNCNPCLTWQAGNACVKQDANGNKRPMKPKDDEYRTIDGIVTGVMAYEMACMFEPSETVTWI